MSTVLRQNSPERWPGELQKGNCCQYMGDWYSCPQQTPPSDHPHAGVKFENHHSIGGLIGTTGGYWENFSDILLQRASPRPVTSGATATVLPCLTVTNNTVKPTVQYWLRNMIVNYLYFVIWCAKKNFKQSPRSQYVFQKYLKEFFPILL